MSVGVVTMVKPDPMQLELEHCRANVTGLEIDESLSKPQWRQLGGALGQYASASQWWIGDWLCFGETKWGEMYDEAMEITGLAYKTLAAAKRIANAIQFERRRSNLPWSHHYEVSALPVDEQDRYLDAAEPKPGSKTPQLTRDALRKKLQQRRKRKAKANGKDEAFDLDAECLVIRHWLDKRFETWPVEHRSIFLAELSSFIQEWKKKV